MEVGKTKFKEKTLQMYFIVILAFFLSWLLNQGYIFIVVAGYPLLNPKQIEGIIRKAYGKK